VPREPAAASLWTPDSRSHPVQLAPMRTTHSPNRPAASGIEAVALAIVAALLLAIQALSA